MGKDISLAMRVFAGTCALLGTIGFPLYTVGAGIAAREDGEVLRNYYRDGRKALRWAYTVAFRGRYPDMESVIV